VLQPAQPLRRHRFAPLLGVALLATLLLAPVAGRVAAATPAIHISAGGLEPSSLTVPSGTTLTWVNDDGQRHRVRSRSGPAEFDSGDLDPGQTFTFTFRSTGTYEYRDDRNPDLSIYFGTVVVANAPPSTPAATAPPGASAPPGGSAPPPIPPAAGAVGMAGRAFSPATLTIDLGRSVTWLNDDGRDHTVSARDQAFDSGVLKPGGTYVRTFASPGTFGYLCLIHPDMTGTIVVLSASGATPPPTPPPTPTPTPPPPSPGSVSIVDFDYQPTALSISAGSSVTFVNRGAALHTITARDGSFDSGFLAAGGTYRRTFPTAGTYPYFCSIHPNMLGSVLVAGPGGGTPPPAAPTPQPTPRPSAPPGAITIADFAFRPGTVTVQPGATLTWLNTGAAPHTVTSRAGLFDSGLIGSGGRYSHTFAQPGTYQYFCTFHPDMSATILVPAPGGAVPPPAPAPPPPPPSVAGDVRIADFSFGPATLSVPAGSTVRWVNGGVAPHTVTARDGSFDSGFLSTGDGFARTLTIPGTIEYFCTLHPTMTGTVIVTGAGGRPPAAGAQSSSPSSSPSAPRASPPPGEPGVTDVALLDFRVDPPTLTVASGARIRFVNQGAALHTATFPGGWDTGFLEPGRAATLTFGVPGSYAYLCAIHPTMIGTLIVTAAPTPSPGQGGPDAGAGGGSGPLPGRDPNAGAPPGVEPPLPGPGQGPVAPLVAVVLMVAGVGSFGWVIRGAALPRG